MDNVTFRRRNRLRKHFAITSNVLLFGYLHASHGAELSQCPPVRALTRQQGPNLGLGVTLITLGTLPSDFLDAPTSSPIVGRAICCGPSPGFPDVPLLTRAACLT